MYIGRCATMLFVIASPALHLIRITLLMTIIETLPQVQVGAEVISKISMRLVDFFAAAMSSTTTMSTVALGSFIMIMPPLIIGVSAPQIARRSLVVLVVVLVIVVLIMMGATAPTRGHSI